MRKLANNSNSYESSLQISRYCRCDDMLCPVSDDPYQSYKWYSRLQRDRISSS